MLITPDQIRAARALLRMDQEELARRANVSIVTIRRSEASGGMGLVGLGTFDEIRRALEAAGAEFIETFPSQNYLSATNLDSRLMIIVRSR